MNSFNGIGVVRGNFSVFSLTKLFIILTILLMYMLLNVYYHNKYEFKEINTIQIPIYLQQEQEQQQLQPHQQHHIIKQVQNSDFILKSNQNNNNNNNNSDNNNHSKENNYNNVNNSDRNYEKYQRRDLQYRQQLHERDVTATPKPSTIDLNDIFITVKTTKIYHDTRLKIIIDTWFQLAKQQTWFFTDTDDKQYQIKTNNHLINTNCSMGHFRKALCCKMSVEFDTFLDSGKKWFCHFDDDNYVNIPKLVQLLNDYSSTNDWYLGKPSISSPLEIFVDNKQLKLPHKKISFVFATGGAGFCISRALALKMLPIAGIGKFNLIGDRIGLPDDVTIGYIIEYLLKVNLTVVDSFHSHLEPMEYLRPETFRDQISFSYKDDQNVLNIDGLSKTSDPTRFYSLHCYLFPYNCKNQQQLKKQNLGLKN